MCGTCFVSLDSSELPPAAVQLERRQLIYDSKLEQCVKNKGLLFGSAPHLSTFI